MPEAVEPTASTPLDQAAEEEDEDEQVLVGLHAKIFAVRKGKKLRLWVGSANATQRAWNGENVEILAELTAVSDLRWTRLTRWRALMCHFFDIAEVCAAASGFRRLRIEGSDLDAARLFAGWLASALKWGDGVKPDLREKPGASPIDLVVLGDGTQELTLRLAANRSCVESAARVHGLAPASRIVSLGDQGLAALLGEELRIRSRDLAFERAVAASKGFV